MDYAPGRFAGSFDNESGQVLWQFLIDPENIVRMETATYLSKPAVEPLSPILEAKFGREFFTDRMRQVVGHMVRQIMEAKGKVVDRSNVRILAADNMFGSGTRYKEVSRAEGR